MEKLLFTAMLLLTVGIIYLITGRNKRQINKIPEGMAILCEPPGRRYVVYALGVLMVVVVGFFTVLYIMDGASEEARSTWIICVIVTILSAGLMIFSGNAMAKECTYFNEEYIQIERSFRKARIVRWHEIRRMSGSFDNTIQLYLSDETKILTLNVGMVNYIPFCDMIKKNSHEAVAGYYAARTYEAPQKRVLRYGAEYYLLSVFGILLLLLYLGAVGLGSAEDFDIIEELLQREPSEWFSFLFAPVYGVVSLVLLFVASRTKIRYTDEKMTLQYPLRRKKEIYWRDIQNIRVTTMRKQGMRVWKKMWIYTAQAKYKINFELMNRGKDDFITQVEKMAEKYGKDIR